MARYIDADLLIDKLEELQFNAPVMTPVMKIYNVIELVEDTPTANVLHIDDVFRLIAGHSDYHGDDILAALMCVTEGKEVKTVRPLEDVVEVVRCKDCKRCFEKRTKRNNQLMRFCMRMDGNEYQVDANDFCSYGERRDT